MKTLIIVLFCAFSSYGQNFMMRMDVMEIYDDTTLYSEGIKVIWGSVLDREISVVWNDKMLYFTKQKKHITRKQRISIKAIEKKCSDYHSSHKPDQYTRLLGVFLNSQNEVFFIKIITHNGIMIRINRMDESTPCYLFQTI